MTDVPTIRAQLLETQYRAEDIPAVHGAGIYAFYLSSPSELASVSIEPSGRRIAVDIRQAAGAVDKASQPRPVAVSPVSFDLHQCGLGGAIMRIIYGCRR